MKHEATVYRQTKQIRALDGTIRTLVSYDGESFGMDDHRAHMRFKRTVQLRPKTKNGRSREDAAAGRISQPKTEKEAPMFMPATRITGSMLGRATGKKQRFRRNLRRR